MEKTTSEIKNIAILGSTGSIGRQTLEVCGEYPHRLRPVVLVAGHKVEELAIQALRWKPKMAVIADPALEQRLRDLLNGSGITVASGDQAVKDAMTLEEIDIVVTATVGYSGLAPTLSAIEAGKDIALANKETLVVAGDLVTRKLASSRSKVIPVDSEHSAIYQCLVGEKPEAVKKLIITASGGPFRTWSHERIASATRADALHHPNWSMGAKITIDSATMVNKAFEIIEARWLFGISPEKIEAIVHPQSIVHSMVEFVDGSVKAQLGLPDMRGPIRYALAGATRPATATPGLDFRTLSTLTFEQPDASRFPGITLAHLALERGGLVPCVINAANEIAVAAFLQDKIRFTDIFPLIMKSVETLTDDVATPSYEDYVECNRVTRARTTEFINSVATVHIC
ncbi:MAG: 1-deoxy-D-xylulose-5-phosphate reductoisomerase [Muribaculaceae bacterium]|nr:1-deoxy-D-xylulose-5-phosphate reductoisomerase [Muribaculaceae bacterium]